MTDRVTWRPQAATPMPLAWQVPAPASLGALLDLVKRLRETLVAPVQALRADRVLSMDHLAMARAHADRARVSGRARTNDPALETLLFAACSRQIQTALAELGHSDAEPVPMVLVALPERPLAADLVERAHALSAHATPWMPDPSARAWWTRRLGLPAVASERDVEDALLSAMAALAVAKQ